MLDVVRENQHWNSNISLLDLKKTFFPLRILIKIEPLFYETRKRNNNIEKVLNEMPIVSNLSKKSTNILIVDWLVQTNDTLDYGRINGKSFTKNHVVKEGWSIQKEHL